MSKKQRNGDTVGLKGSALWGLLVFFILIFVDQITKVWADVYFNGENAPASIVIIPNMIALCISYNDGIAFGSLGDSSPFVKILIIVVTAVMMGALTVLYFRLDKRRSFLRNALVFVVAGGVGNLIDRVYYKIWETGTGLGVRDMVRVNIVFDFGVCNFADFFIVGGAVVDENFATEIGAVYAADPMSAVTAAARGQSLVKPSDSSSVEYTVHSLT